MNRHDDFDRTLAAWFESEALAPAPAEGLERILDGTRRRRPRPSWLAAAGSRWVGDAPTTGPTTGLRSLPRLDVRWSTALVVLLVVAALVGGAILIAARLRQPTPLPTGRLGHLAYAVDGDLYLADWDGANPVKVVDGVPDGGPLCQDVEGEGRMWSPDGQYLAYRSGCRGSVELVDPEGHSVASFPGQGWLVSWSPDSRRIATWVDLGRTVGIYGVDGVRQALLTVPPGCPAPGDFDPVWSPDGSSVVIVPCEVPVDGSTPRHLGPDDPRSHFQWAYAPDGARVAYVAGGSLFVAARDGSQHRVLISGGLEFGPRWSPTGDRIAFTVRTAPDRFDLRVVDVASGQVTQLADVRGVGASFLVGFSPEGDRILYWAGVDDVPSLWSVNTDGSHAQVLVTGAGWGDWQWLPAGS